MYQRILVPIDGSATSNRGLDEAIQLARQTGAQLQLMHVVDELVLTMGFEAYAGVAGDLVGILKAAGEKILADGKARALDAGVKAETKLFEGFSPRLDDLVAEQVKAWGADLIVIGTHGRRGAGRLLMGSGAEQIVRSACVPVLLVRAHDDAAATAGAPAKPASA